VQLDCFLPCQCSAEQVRCQVILDKILYDVDRAIDALSLGIDSNGKGDAEKRAFAYGLIIETFLLNNNLLNIINPPADNIAAALRDAQTRVDKTRQVDDVKSGSAEDTYLANLKNDLTNLQTRYSSQSKNPFFQCVAANSLIQEALIDAYKAVFLPDIPSPPAIPPTSPTLIPPTTSNPPRLAFPPPPLENTILQELCMQEDAENQWNNLLQTLAPSCFPEAESVNATTLLVQLTRGIRTIAPCGPVEVTIPPDVPTSLAGFVFREHSDGGRRN
jgi:hypothetical protein